MKNLTELTIRRKLLSVFILFAASFSQAQAAPLPNGTLLGIEQGAGASSNIPCATGSCFYLEIAPGVDVWTDIEPGTDGGIVIGKNQTSGGQELISPSDTLTTSGEMTNAWKFFANFGTYYSPTGASDNFFNDTSCSGTSCIGNTQLGSFNAAWNGHSIPMGSAEGCNSLNCSPDQLAGIFIDDYNMNGYGNPWSMVYLNVIPDGDPSGFGNVKFWIALRGVVGPEPSPTPPPKLNNFLPAGTLLTIEPAVGSGFCQTGSCFGMPVAPGVTVWTNFGPGTDGGIIIGKNQASGGQELAPSPTNDTPGEMTDAWNFFANFGTFYTPNGVDDNFFTDTSCSGADCIANTQLGSFNAAWNGTSIPLGSANGCNSPSCTPDQLAGIFIFDWVVNQDGTYLLHYRSIVPDGDSSSFGNVPVALLLRGRIILPTRDNQSPVAEPVTVRTRYEQSVNWQPVASDADKDTLVCHMLAQPLNGTTLVNKDCSIGTYTPNTGFSGTDCSTVQVIDPYQATATASICVVVEPPVTTTACQDNNLLARVTLSGSGQGQTVNDSLKVTFTGHLVEANDRTIKVCAYTRLGYEAKSTVGIARCRVGGRNVAPSGTINLRANRDKLSCTNKPDGRDTDRYRIKPVKD